MLFLYVQLFGKGNQQPALVLISWRKKLWVIPSTALLKKRIKLSVITTCNLFIFVNKLINLSWFQMLLFFTFLAFFTLFKSLLSNSKEYNIKIISCYPQYDFYFTKSNNYNNSFFAFLLILFLIILHCINKDLWISKNIIYLKRWILF